MASITRDALTCRDVLIEEHDDLTTLVVGRNWLFARLAAIYAHGLGANCINMGVMGQEHSGYRDCSREYMDLLRDHFAHRSGQPSVYNLHAAHGDDQKQTL